jgi:hypothetical protein
VSEFSIGAVGTHLKQFFGNWIVKDEVAVEESVVCFEYQRDERMIEQKTQFNMPLY